MESRPARLIVVCGLPGAGKTTHARELEASLSAIRFCPDEWMADLGVSAHDEPFRTRLEALQWSFARRLLSLGGSVVVEWGTWGRFERDALREEARAIGAEVELHYLTAPVEILFERIQRRGMEDPPIPFQDLRRWAETIEVPTPEEMALYDRAATFGA